MVEGKQVYFGYNYGLTDDLTKQKKMSRGGVLDGSGIDDTSQITAGEYIGVFDYASITYLVARVSESEDSKMLGKFVVRAASIDVFPHVGGEIVLKGDTSSSENFEDLSECFEGKLNSDEWQNVETFQDVLRVCEATVSIHDAYYTYIVGNAKMLTATSFPWNRFEAMKKNFRSFAESRREGSTIVDPKTIFGAPKCLKRELSMPLAQLYFK